MNDRQAVQEIRAITASLRDIRARPKKIIDLQDEENSNWLQIARKKREEREKREQQEARRKRKGTDKRIVIDLQDEENSNWLQIARKKREEREKREQQERANKQRISKKPVPKRQVVNAAVRGVIEGIEKEESVEKENKSTKFRIALLVQESLKLCVTVERRIQEALTRDGVLPPVRWMQAALESAQQNRQVIESIGQINRKEW